MCQVTTPARCAIYTAAPIPPLYGLYTGCIAIRGNIGGTTARVTSQYPKFPFEYRRLSYPVV